MSLKNILEVSGQLFILYKTSHSYYFILLYVQKFDYLLIHLPYPKVKNLNSKQSS